MGGIIGDVLSLVLIANGAICFCSYFYARDFLVEMVSVRINEAHISELK